MSESITNAYPLFFNNDGVAIENGSILIGTASLDPGENPISVYSDPEFQNEISQRITTNGGYPYSSGAPVRIWVNANDYSLRLNDKNGAKVWEDLNAGKNASSYYSGRPLYEKLGDFVSVKDYGATGDAVTDDYDAINLALASGAGTIYFPPGNYRVSEPLVLNTQSQVLQGAGQNKTFIVFLTGFTGDSVINIDGARQVGLRDLYVGGTTGVDCIHITNGQLAEFSNIMVKFGDVGIKLIAGNSQRWWNVFAESCGTGFLVEPDSGDDTNGCSMYGVRAFNCSEWGLDVVQGAGATGHMHSHWDMSSESGVNGVRVRGGRYCWYELYAESNSGDDYDLDNGISNPNFIFIKNPDNDDDGELFSLSSSGAGIKTSGATMFFDAGIGPERFTEVDFAVSGSLANIGVKMIDITNSSGSTRNLTLSFLSTMPAGFRCVITKRDNTSGFNLIAPGGITLTGDLTIFGASTATVKRLEIIKINTTTAICIQSGS